MERQIEYRLDAEDLKIAIVAYVGKLHGELSIKDATVFIGGNEADQKTMMAVVRAIL